jgi:hypothetical protein
MARASIFLTALIALVPALPESCAKILGITPPPPPPPVDVPPAPALPVTSATAPPVWSPPESSAPAPPVAASASVSPSSDPLSRARAFAQAGEHKKVRAILEKRVKAGKASPEEAALLVDSCVALRDKACIETVRSKHPELNVP